MSQSKRKITIKSKKRPPATCRLLVLWLISLVCAAPSVRAGQTNGLFSPTRLLEVRLEMATNDWDHLRREHHDLLAALGPTRFRKPEPQPYRTYPADVTIDGVTVKSVGLRKRGFLGSASTQRPSLGIRFDEFDPTNRVWGLKRISLNNNLQDPSLVHQALAYHVFARANVPAPRCNFARVTVNGQYLGVYSHVEAVESEFLRRNFGDAGGHLYEGQLSDFRPEWVNTYERKNHKDDRDRSDLDAVVKAMEAPDGELLARLAPLVDVEAYLGYWAVESLIGHWDSYSNNGNNFFVYRLPATKKFQFIPWGADSVFGDPDPFTPAKTPESVKARSILPWRLYRLPAARERYRERLRQVLQSAWDERDLLAEVDRLEALLRPHLGPSQSQFKPSLGRVRTFIRTRRAALDAELAGPAPEYPLAMKKSGCLEKSGTFEATFDTTWQGKGVSNEVVQSSVTLSVKIGGEPRTFRSPTVITTLATDARCPGCPTMTFMAARWLAGQMEVPTIIFQPEAFQQGTHQMEGFNVAGYLFEGRLWQDRRWSLAVLMGTVELKEAGTKPGAKIRGKIQADIYQLPQ